MNYSLKSYAKINLFLRVLYKRDDQFHEIRSIILPITFYDILRVNIFSSAYITNPDEIRFSSDNRIKFRQPFQEFEKVSERGDFRKNLLFRLFAYLLDEGIKIPVLRIHLIKNIPPGAGLGGGSSNAGTLLKFFLDRGLIDLDLALKVASALGSDVPFFLFLQPSWVEGRGEIIKPLKVGYNFQSVSGILALSSVMVPTKLAYQKLQRNTVKTNQGMDNYSPETHGIEYFFYEKNDFEEVITREFPVLEEVRNILRQTGPFTVKMTGSGSAFFALYENKTKIVAAYKKLKLLDLKESIFIPFRIYTGQSPSGKASDFGSDMRRFESSLPSHYRE